MGLLVICDEEEEYVMNLLEYITGKKGVPFRVKAFSNMDFMDNLKGRECIDILLMSSSIECEDVEKFGAKKVIFLTKEKNKEICSEYRSLYKYQSAENIYSELVDCYVEIGGELGYGTRASDLKVVGVYSPIGRTGKTSFALTLGQILVNSGSTLYMNMEEFSGFSGIFEKYYEGDMSDLMYYYRQSSQTLQSKLKAIVKEFHGMDYVPPMVYSGDIRNVPGNMWIDMITDIINTGIYSNIVLDLSNMIGNVFDILDLCDIVYMPINDDRVSMCKINEFEEYLLKTGREEILNRIVKMKLPMEDKIVWNEEYMEQLIWGKMGDFVRKIIREDVA